VWQVPGQGQTDEPTPALAPRSTSANAPAVPSISWVIGLAIIPSAPKCQRLPSRPEQVIHKTVIDHLAARGASGVFAFHCPNGGARSPIEAAILKGLGVVPGIPDLIILTAGRIFALELKAPGKKPTPTQARAMEAMGRAGVTVSWVAGLDPALAQLEAWGLLRGGSQ
jgi:hypothetical protein